MGLVAKVGGALPWATMQELRRGIRAFSSHSKPTVAWAETFGEVSDLASYVLATAFDEVWLQPGGYRNPWGGRRDDVPAGGA